MNRSLTVSIVLYKTPAHQVRQSIETLICFQGLKCIYVVDNSPTDILRGECTSTTLCDYVHIPGNPGFGAAHNIALRKAMELNAEYHLVLNADVYFDCKILDPMLEYMNRNHGVGHLMPKVLNPDGTVQYLCKLVPSPFDLFLRRFSPNNILNQSKGHFELRESGYNKIMFVPYLSGCFMLLRLESLKHVGLFDERFFMYPEDIDLTRRIAEKYETLFFPSVSVVHEHGAASRKSIKMFFVHFINLVKYFNKWGWVRDPARQELNEKTLDQFRH